MPTLLKLIKVFKIFIEKSVKFFSIPYFHSLTMSQYLCLIDEAIQACVEQNASRFCSLFTEDGKIVLNQNLSFSKAEIETVTQKYFASLKYVKIETKYIMIEGNKAFIQWSWFDFNLVDNQENSHENVIVLDFKDSLIYCWQEYKG